MAIDNTVLDVRDIIARVEALREYSEDAGEADADELRELSALLKDLAGNGGDEQWEGDWYPVTLIRDSYFREYAQELAEDIGAINHDAGWPARCIDWDQAARELRMDYTSCEFGGVTYWYR